MSDAKQVYVTTHTNDGKKIVSDFVMASDDRSFGIKITKAASEAIANDQILVVKVGK